MTTFRISLIFLVGFLIGVAILLSFPNLPSGWTGLVLSIIIVGLAALVAEITK